LAILIKALSLMSEGNVDIQALLSGYKSNRISCLVFSDESVWERAS